MTRFAVICPPFIGHFNPTLALCLELCRRNHEVHLIGVPEMTSKMAPFPITFHVYGEEEFPADKVAEELAILASKTGLDALRFGIEKVVRESRILLRDCFSIVEKIKPDCLIIDQVNAGAVVIARHFNVPFVTTCNMLCITPAPGTPPFNSPRIYTGTWFNRMVSNLEQYFANIVTRPVYTPVREKQLEWNQPLAYSTAELDSPLAVICQLTPSFDFPRNFPSHFHFVGKFTDPTTGLEPLSKAPHFDWSRLDSSKKLIYASMGTLQNGIKHVYDKIASACAELDDVQLVLALGNRDAKPWKMDGNPLVVPFAPQEQLIKCADVVITHAGLNTIMSSLMYGKPLVAIPIAHDQPATSARIVYSGVGKRILLNELNVDKLRAAIMDVLKDPSYMQNAQKIQGEMEGLGVTRAADIIDEVVRTKSPVPNDWIKPDTTC